MVRGGCRYTSFVDRVYLGGEIVLLALLAYYILAEILEMRKEGRVYFKDVRDPPPTLLSPSVHPCTGPSRRSQSPPR